MHELQRHFEREPFGERRGDLQAALVASTVANMAGKELRRRAKLSEFDAFRDAPERAPLSPMERIAAMKAILTRGRE